MVFDTFLLFFFFFFLLSPTKAEYGWGMEFAEGTLPDHMKTPGPGPWDWCVVAEKTT